MKQLLSADKKLLNPEQKIDVALITLGYRQAPLSLFTSFIVATLIFTVFYPIIDHRLLLSWFGFFCIVAISRLLLNWCFWRRKSNQNIEIWRTFFIIGCFFGGLSWGLTGGLFVPELSYYEQTIVFLVLAGITAGSVPVLSSIVWSAITFLLTCLIPLIMTLFYIRIEPNYIFDIAVIIYLTYLIILAIRTHHMIRQSISLQFENNLLLDDLTDAKSQLENINEKLTEAATHDPLTKVANRNLFLTYLEAAAKRTKINKKMFALLYIDLDDFKLINDLYGHHIGDKVLLILVDRLIHVCKRTDSISRLGGDEFTIILENINNPYDVAKIAQRICQTIAAPFDIDDNEVKISASIGISIYPSDSDDIEKILNIADKAMYSVKDKGGNNYRFNIELLTE